ncbi:unnamed protein product [Meganyctiphanes norvegica]|uniref:C2H2-type domain-containing protein n=1 Tax=Meganyctiphanes norvegica TaxID=48144 RepID=A0AAV2SMH2_MEGNR
MEINEMDKNTNNNLQMEVDEEKLISNHDTKRDNKVIPMIVDTELEENWPKVVQEDLSQDKYFNVTNKDISPLKSIKLTVQAITSELTSLNSPETKSSPAKSSLIISTNSPHTLTESSITKKIIITAAAKINKDTILDSKEAHAISKGVSIVGPKVPLNIGKSDTSIGESHTSRESHTCTEESPTFIEESNPFIDASSSPEEMSLNENNVNPSSKNVSPILDCIHNSPKDSSHRTSDVPSPTTATSTDEEMIKNNLKITPNDTICIQKETTLKLTDTPTDTTVSNKSKSPPPNDTTIPPKNIYPLSNASMSSNQNNCCVQTDISLPHKDTTPIIISSLTNKYVTPVSSFSYKDITPNPSDSFDSGTQSADVSISNNSSEMSLTNMDITATVGDSFLKVSDVSHTNKDIPNYTPFTHSTSANALPSSIVTEKYKCKKCNYVCGNLELYKKHLDSHISSNSVCDFTSANLLDDDEDDDICIVDEHINTNNSFKESERQKICNTCRCTFVLKHLESLKVQILIYKNVNMSPCGECMEKYRQISSYHQSMQFGQGSNIFSCIYCDFQCNVSEDLQTHMHIHEAEELEVAPQIEGQFSSQYDTFDTQYDSSLDDQMFQSSSWQPMESWRPQMEILPIQGTYGCPHCDYRTNYMSYLKHHLLTHNDERPYSCPYCNYKAKLSKTLKHHISRHTGEKPFACPYCDYRAIQKTSMIEHVRTHTGERPHQCPLCPYAAINGRLLKKHIETKHNSNKSHTANRTYTCPHCDFITTYKSELKSHIKEMHKAETPVKEKRPFACPHCSYRAQSGQSLTHHIYTHTGEKPYACPHCDYRARQKKTLNLHIQTHTGEKRHHCPHCDYAAIYKSCLKLHIVKKHPGMAQPKKPRDPTQHFLSNL